jgi:hypothetical protein
VFIIAGTTSVNEVAWNAAMKAFGVPTKKWKALHAYLAQRIGQNPKELLGSAPRLHPKLDPGGLTSHSDLRGRDLAHRMKRNQDLSVQQESHQGDHINPPTDTKPEGSGRVASVLHTLKAGVSVGTWV